MTLPDLPIYVHLVPDDMALTARVRGLLPRGAILTTGPLPGADGHVLIADLRCHVADIPAGRRTLVLTDDSPVPDSLADCFDIIDTDGLDARLPRAVRALVEMEALRVDAALEHQTVHTLNEIGYALAAITDHNELLNRIVQKAREAVKADAGTLYLVGDDHHLYFTVAQNDTIPFPSDTPHLAVDKTSLAGWCVHQGTPALIDDVYRIPPDAPYQWNTNFDDFSGYRTHSMLLVPLFSRDGTVAGALALINRKARMDIPISPQNPALPFTQRDLDLARSIAAQAAVALDNFRLYAEIRTLFDGFVDAAVTTIEARDPTTGGHSKRVAALTLALARAVHEETEPPFLDIQFCEEDIVQIQFAGMLHDFGKVAVREQILLKAEKLYPWELERIEARFRVMAMQVLREAVQDEGTALPGQLLQLQKDLAMVRRTNRPDRATTEQDVNTLSAIAERWRLPDTGEPILADVERDRLRISRGSLDRIERLETEEHVLHTWRFLRLIPWTRYLRNVPDIAAAHHEKLDGSGYPRGLIASQIPYAARLMAICDIWDAVTASDRPYRNAMTIPEAMRVIRAEAAQGKLDKDAVELFIRRRLWETSGRPAE